MPEITTYSIFCDAKISTYSIISKSAMEECLAIKIRYFTYFAILEYDILQNVPFVNAIFYKLGNS